jgi:glycerophosphoryl diester phosphodiesterase
MTQKLLHRRTHLSGHRGARGLAPENTLEGFALAFALGCDSVELDVALTRDGIPVVLHDPVLHPDILRGPDGRWLEGTRLRVADLPRAALLRLDAGRLRPGSAYAAQFPQQRPRDGARIPALADVLALARPAGAIVDIELKTMPDRPALTPAPEALAEAVLACVAAQSALGRVAVRSFDWRGLRHVARHAPQVTLGFLTSPGTAAEAALWWGVNPAAHGHSVPSCVAAVAAERRAMWCPEHRSLTRAALREAHALGLEVMPWTVNDPDDIARLMEWGVDGICTDYPDRVQAGRVFAAGPY